jgi:hypothetical protein
MMEHFNVLKQPNESDLLLLPKAVSAICDKYPDEQNRFLVYFKTHELGLLIDWYIVDDEYKAECIGVMNIKTLSSNYNNETNIISRDIQIAVEEKIAESALQQSAEQGTYYRVKDRLTGMDIQLYEGQVYDINAVLIGVELL